MKYDVAIEEVMSRVIEVEAVSEEEAYGKAYDMYTDESVVLDSGDFLDFNIIVLGETE